MAGERWAAGEAAQPKGLWVGSDRGRAGAGAGRRSPSRLVSVAKWVDLGRGLFSYTDELGLSQRCVAEFSGFWSRGFRHGRASTRASCGRRRVGVRRVLFQCDDDRIVYRVAFRRRADRLVSRAATIMRLLA